MATPKEEEKATFWNEFMKFALRGNMINLAIGIIIGTAFNNLVQSLVDDLIMPIIGNIIGNVDFSQLYIVLSGRDYGSLAAAEEAGAPVLKYGLFITNVIDFLILALTVFVVLRYVIRYKPEGKK